MIELRTRVMTVAVVGALAFALSPVAAVAEPSAPPSTCTAETLADLNRQIIELNGRISAHNGQSVDRTDAGAVAQYNAQADALERERSGLQQRIADCQRALDAGNTPEPSGPAPAPTQPGTPPSDSGVPSRGSAPLFMWVAVSGGAISDENGNISPSQAAEVASSYGTPPGVVAPGDYATYQGRRFADIVGEYVDPTSGRWKWPADHGFQNPPRIRLRFDKGAPLDGFLNTDPESGLWGLETPYAKRSLPPGTLGPYVKVDGTGKSLPRNYQLLTGSVGPAFDTTGGGTKWLVVNTDTGAPVPIAQLIAEGYLTKLN